MTGLLVKKFLTQEQVDTAMAEMRAMTKQKLVLIGGLAMQAYGSERLTKDIDFLARSVPPEFKTEKILSFGGASGLTPSGVPVCIIVRDDEYKKMYKDALKDTAGTIVSPEYLAIMKLTAGRTKDEEDLRTLISKKTVSVTKARTLIGKYLGKFGIDSFNSFVDEVEWRRSKDEAQDE
jgi:Nucleotidyltransferase of unknown function (DUF6036)